MSGGGSGTEGAGGGGHETDCNIVRRESLTDPDPKVLKKLEKGTTCDVVLEEQARRARILIEYEGETAGVFYYDGFTRLIACIRKGHSYVAVVLGVKGGWCEVEVRPGQQDT